ncbi:MAG: acyltransferase family protein [Pseudomonadota bacterium]
MTMLNNFHRNDIDGLRSVAVLLVVLNHAGFSLFPGGFVGVDIFFVISGFLITSIIFNGLLDNTFSFANFYVRRIKRLMPALFVVLFVTTIFALLYLYPSDLKKYANSLTWVIFYVSNFYFWLKHGGYFEGNTQEAPLLHTWSLAVEEQYYLIWPLYLIVGLKLFSPRVFAIATVGLFFLCVVFSEWALNVAIGAAYYLLPTRMFELMLGSLLAIFWKDIPKLPQMFMHIISLCGLGLIAYAAFFLDETSSFPGFNALYPTVGAACLLLANREHMGCVNRVLSLSPFVFIGLISYSLYLWHWPILVFVRYQGIPMTFVVQASCITLSIVLAWLSWKFVETPVRNSKNVSLLSVADLWLLRPLVMVMVISFVLLSRNGLEMRYSGEINQMDQAVNALSHEMRPLCHASLSEAARSPDVNCRLGVDNGDEFDAFLFGDSHANHLAGFIDVLAKDANVQVQDYTLDQCPAIFYLEWGRNPVTAEACKKRNAVVLERIKNNKFDYVLLGSSWPANPVRVYREGEWLADLVESSQIIETSFAATIGAIIESGATPVVFDDIPDLGANDSKCPIRREAFNEKLDCGMSKQSNKIFEAVLSRVQVIYPQIVRINLADLMCENDICKLDLDGMPLYSDNDHLNYSGAEYMGQRYLQLHENFFKPAGKTGL